MKIVPVWAEESMKVDPTEKKINEGCLSLSLKKHDKSIHRAPIHKERVTALPRQYVRRRSTQIYRVHKT